MLKRALPVTMSRLSTPRIRLPMILKSRGFFSAASTAARSGAGMRGARATRATRRSPCGSTPRASRCRCRSSARLTGTFHCCRGGVQHQESPAGADQPHVLVVGRNRAAAAFRLRAVLRVRSACLIVTCVQSTSNSSAMICGSAVLIPCPVSGFFAMIVNVLFGMDGDVGVRRRATRRRTAGAARPGRRLLGA